MIWLENHAIIVFAAVLIVVTAILILQPRRTPQSTLAWLLFVIMLPYVAVPAFLALGFRKQSESFDRVTFQDGKAPARIDRDRHSIDHLLRCYGQPPATEGNRVKLLTSGETAFEELMALIEDAEQRIEATFYVLARDAVGRLFVEALIRRAEEGVAVRLLLDWYGSLFAPRAELRNLVAAGGEVAYFAPFLRNPLKGYINLRNHRKMVIADGRRVFSGGMNIGDVYLGPIPSKKRWRDLAYRLEGPAVSAFGSVFASDWQAAGNPAPPPIEPDAPRAMKGGAVAQLAVSGPDIPNDALHDAILTGCHNAKQRIWIVTPYFLPTPALNEALAIAGRRGVDTRIIVPKRSNQRIADFARGAYLRELQDAWCGIYFYLPGMNHAKATVIDGTAIVGSANIDIRSLLLNFEASLVLYSKAEVDGIAEWIETLCARSAKGVPETSRLRHLVEGFFRLGAPIM